MYVQICDILLLFSYNEVRILSDCDLNVMNIVVIKFYFFKFKYVLCDGEECIFLII